MRCPSCGRNHKKKEGMRCGCGYLFVFNPASDGITDGKFSAAVRAAGANETYFFTFNQLYATVCRRTRAKRSQLIGGFVVSGILFAIAVALGVAMSTDIASGLLPVMVFCAVIGLIVLVATSVLAFKRPPDVDRVRRFVDRWIRAGHEIPNLITERCLVHPPSAGPESDLYDYGAERLLIVERDQIVDWLVLNNFHAQERAVVISQKGYPEYLGEHVTRMLSDNPDLKVYLLHDATRVGQDLYPAIVQGRHRLSGLLAGHAIVDLGLSDADVNRIKTLRLFRKARGGVPVDYVPYGMLCTGMGAAMLQGIALSSLPARTEDDGGTTGFG